MLSQQEGGYLHIACVFVLFRSLTTPRVLLRPSSLLSPQTSPAQQEAYLLRLLATLPPTRQRLVKAWCDFQFDSDNPTRRALWEQMQAHPLTRMALVATSRTLQPSELFAAKARYMFDVSPPGHGVDCYRTWESIVLGMIPIVQGGTHLDVLFDELPAGTVVRVRNFTEVTPANLLVWARRYEQQHAWAAGANHSTVQLKLADGRTVRVPKQLTNSYWLQLWRRALRRKQMGTDSSKRRDRPQTSSAS
jgi:hypothetical protein